MARSEVEKQSDKDPRSVIYDLLGRLGPEAVDHGKKLFVMAGQRGMAGGYFFEKSSAEFLGGLGIVIILDESGNEVGKLPDRSAIFDAFYVRPPKWLEAGKKYQVIEPKINREDLEILWDLRQELLTRLRNEGLDASNEFLLIGTAIGGKPADPEEVIKDIQARVDSALSGLKNRKK